MMENKQIKLWYIKNGLNYDKFVNLAKQRTRKSFLPFQMWEDIFMEGTQEIIKCLNSYDFKKQRDKNMYFFYPFNEGMNNLTGKYIKKIDLSDKKNKQSNFEKSIQLNYNEDESDEENTTLLETDEETKRIHLPKLEDMIETFLPIIDGKVEYAKEILLQHFVDEIPLSTLAKELRVSLSTLERRRDEIRKLLYRQAMEFRKDFEDVR